MFQVLPLLPPLSEYNWHMTFLSFQGSAQSRTYRFHPRGGRPEAGHNCFCPSRSWPRVEHTVSILPGFSLEGNMWFLSSQSWPEQDLSFLSSWGLVRSRTYRFCPPRGRLGGGHMVSILLESGRSGTYRFSLPGGRAAAGQYSASMALTLLWHHVKGSPWG